MLLVLVLLSPGGGCRRAAEEDAATGGSGPDASEVKRADVLVFPEEAHVADAAVNDFVARAMSVCGRGDYDSFRLLWSVREEPLPRDEFEEGWHAVETIKVRGLEKARFARENTPSATETDIVYVILAEVRLDPTHRAGRREPKREVVLMLVRENEEWHLARPPKKMRNWIKDRVEARASDGANPGAATDPDNPDGTGAAGSGG